MDAPQPALLIRGGSVADGTGEELVRADVAIADGNIVGVGLDLDGEVVLDASGCVVAPGLIDIHTHYDAQVTWDPYLEPSNALGVTSVVGGNCGYSIAPCPLDMRDLLMRTLVATEDMSYETLSAGIDWRFETYQEYLGFLRARGLGINFGTYIGHTAVRIAVMGDDAYEREASAAEIETMRRIVVDGVRAGALGFATNRSGSLRGDRGRLIPSMIATVVETEALALGVREAGRGIVSLAVGDNPAWAYDLSKKLGRTITWNSILVFPDAGLGSRMNWEEKLAAHEKGRQDAPDVYPQVTPRALTFAFAMENPLPFLRYQSFSELIGRPPAVRAAAFEDHAWRAQASAELDAAGYDWSGIEVAEFAPRSLLNRRVVDIAAEREIPPLSAMLDIALEAGLATRFKVTVANADVDAVSTLLTSDGCVLGLSDAGAHVSQICDAVMPIDFLTNWVRDRDLMPLGAGIRKVTGELADVLGLHDRGYLRVGSRADVVVLEWEQLGVGPMRRVRDLPADGERLVPEAVTGLRHVVVNGQVTRRDGAARSSVLPGMLLEPKA